MGGNFLSNEVAANDKENIYPNPAACQTGKFQMKEQDAQNG
jgi:hypothetical protein